MAFPAPGPIALLGSGETTANAGQIYDLITKGAQAPLPVAILETPAGFQPNSARVAAKVADYMQVRLQNLRPEIALVAARARGSAYSPDDPAVSEALREAALIFLGPGSPTYTVRQLQGSITWERAQARNRYGAAIVTSSAATVAMGAVTVPVYEIFKVGAELHWQPGLDLLRPFGLALAIVPHWDNAEGGAELDTSRCFVGRERFARLMAMLPSDLMVVGVDEHTGLVLDLQTGRAQVLGRGGVTLIAAGEERRYERKSSFSLSELGPFRLPKPGAGLEPAVWADMAPGAAQPPVDEPVAQVPADVFALVDARQSARAARDWAAADAIRGQLAGLGWQVKDTPSGPVLERV